MNYQEQIELNDERHRLLVQDIEQSGVRSGIIIARGKSAEKIQFEKDKSDLVVFVNEVESHLRSKEILDITSNAKMAFSYLNTARENLASQEAADKLKIKYFQSNKKMFAHDMPHWMISACSQLITDPYLNQSLSHLNFGFMPSFFDDTKNMKTNGLMTVRWCIECLKLDKIRIYGLDFFEVPYQHYHINTGNPEVLEYQPGKGKIAKEQFLDVCKSANNSSIEIYTYADFSMYDIPENLTFL